MRLKAYPRPRSRDQDAWAGRGHSRQTRSGYESSHTGRFHRNAAVLLVFGLAIPAAAQQSGPLPPAPANLPAPQNVPAQPQDAARQPSTTPATPAGSPAPSQPQIHGAQIQVPTGTHIPLVLHNAISTRSAHAGDPVYFETLFPVMVDGRVAIPAGSYVSGEVTESKRPGRVKGRGELMVKLTTMILPNSYMVNLNAMPSGGAGTGGNETMDKEGKITGDSDKTSDAATIAKTTAAGAGIGAIAARSGTGAGIGAGIGAAVGLAWQFCYRAGRKPNCPAARPSKPSSTDPYSSTQIKYSSPAPDKSSTLPGPPNREPQRSRVPF